MFLISKSECGMGFRASCGSFFGNGGPSAEPIRRCHLASEFHPFANRSVIGWWGVGGEGVLRIGLAGGG